MSGENILKQLVSYLHCIYYCNTSFNFLTFQMFWYHICNLVLLCRIMVLCSVENGHIYRHYILIIVANFPEKRRL